MFRTMKMVSDEPHDESATSSSLSVKNQLPSKAQSAAPVDLRLKKQVRRQQVVFGGLPRHPPLSGVEVLTSRLVASINEKGPSNQIRLFGPFIGEVPRRLGSTAALTDAAACLTTTHDNIIRRSSKTRINPQLYAKALKSLHAAIEDPQQVRSTSTLCATVLLAITEAYAMGACGTNRNFTTHMGGAARILELRGPRDFQNPSSFERALLRAVTVGVGLDAVFSGKEDLLENPEWNKVAFDATGVAEPRATMFKIARAMSYLPSLTRDVRAFFSGTSSPDITPLSLLRRAETLHAMLDKVQPYIAETLADPTRVRRVAPSPEHADLWPMGYRFADAGVAFVLWFYWNMRMITFLIIAGLHQRPASSPFLPPQPSYVAALGREARAMARDLCMSWEHAHAVRPLGAMYLDVGLIVAYSVFAEGVGEEEGEQEDEEAWERRLAWLLRALAQLTAGRPGEGTGMGIVGQEFRGADWTAERVERLGALWTGLSRRRRKRAEARWYGSPSLSPSSSPCSPPFQGFGVGAYPAASVAASASSASASPDMGLWEEWGGKQEASLFRVDSGLGDGEESLSNGLASAEYAMDAYSPGSDGSFLVLQPMGLRIPWVGMDALSGGSFV
ncbi:hypothetical protein SLS57_008614 [Botryosphaeria dothidea]